MTTDEVIARLKAEAGKGAPFGVRSKIAEETGLSYGYLSRLVYDEIREPSSARVDKLRQYFEQRA